MNEENLAANEIKFTYTSFIKRSPDEKTDNFDYFYETLSEMMPVPSPLKEVLSRRSSLPNLLERRKRELMSRAERGVKRAVRDLIRDGHLVRFQREIYLVEDVGGAIYLTESAAPTTLQNLKVNLSPKEIFLICWNASSSLVEIAREEKWIHLAILSRGQVIRSKTAFSDAMMDFLSHEGLKLEEFSTLTEGDDPLQEETTLLEELNALKEYLMRIQIERLELEVLAMLDEMDAMIRKGAEEKEINDLLIAVLQAYPVEIDERSTKPGMPDVISYSPLWILFELKNEVAVRSHVDQLRGYLESFRGRASSPLGIPWKGLLVATSASPDLYEYATRKGVRVITWEKLIEFLRKVFSRGAPIDILRKAIDSYDFERELESYLSAYNSDLEARSFVIRSVIESGSIDRDGLIKRLASSSFEHLKELDSIIEELSGPILSLLDEEDGLISPAGSGSFERALRALRYLKKEVYVDG